MPFTFSHPAIVLPLTFLPKKWYSLTGLVIGSLTPDFEYFLRMKIKSTYSHTPGGLFWFDLPLGILLAFAFHNIVRDSLFRNLPILVKSRFSNFENFDWTKHFKKYWPVIIISILIGAASHIFWDSFTHNQGYFAKTIPSLSNTINLLGTEVPIQKILQHSSTLIGGIVILFAIYKIPVKNINKVEINLRYWMTFILITLAILGIRLSGELEVKQYGNLLVTIISACIISLIFSALVDVETKTV